MLAREISRDHVFTRPRVKRAARSHDVADQPSSVRFLCTCQAPSVICCSLRQAIPSVKVCVVLSLARHVVRLCGLRSWVMLASMVITREFLLSFLIPHGQDIPVFIAIASRGWSALSVRSLRHNWTDESRIILICILLTNSNKKIYPVNFFSRFKDLFFIES